MRRPARIGGRRAPADAAPLRPCDRRAASRRTTCVQRADRRRRPTRTRGRPSPTSTRWRPSLTPLALDLALTAVADQWLPAGKPYPGADTEDELSTCPRLSDRLGAALGRKMSYWTGTLPGGPYGCTWATVPLYAVRTPRTTTTSSASASWPTGRRPSDSAGASPRPGPALPVRRGTAGGARRRPRALRGRDGHRLHRSRCPTPGRRRLWGLVASVAGRAAVPRLDASSGRWSRARSRLRLSRAHRWNVSAVTGKTPAMRGLMQDYPLTIDAIFRHVEQHYGDGTIATNNPGGVTRTTYAEWAERTRKLGGVLDTLGISADGRVGHVRLEQPAPPGAVLRRAVAPAGCCTRSTSGCSPSS